MQQLSSAKAKVQSLYQIECVAHFHPDGVKCPFHGVFPLCKERHSARLLWRDGFKNIVVTEGLNTILGRTFDAVGADVNWYVYLQGANTGTIAVSSGSANVTGTTTDFQAADVGSDIIIAGAGASGADYKNTILSRSSTTAIVLNANAGTTVSGAPFAIEPRPADVMNSKSFNEITPYSNTNRPTWTKNGAPSGGAMSNSSSKAAFTINASSRVFGAGLSSNNTKGGTTGLLYGGGLFAISRLVESGDTLNVQVDLSATSA